MDLLCYLVHGEARTSGGERCTRHLYYLQEGMTLTMVDTIGRLSAPWNLTSLGRKHMKTSENWQLAGRAQTDG